MTASLPSERIPASCRKLLRSVEWDPLPGAEISAELTASGPDEYTLTLSAVLPQDTPVGACSVRLRPAFSPSFYWTPHLTPKEGDVVDMHVFRTPALMMGDAGGVLTALPPVDGNGGGAFRVGMDLDAQNNVMAFGVSNTEVYEHVLYRRAPGAVLPKGEFCFSVVLLLQTAPEEIHNPFRRVLRYYWERYGSKQTGCLPAIDTLDTYVERVYHWAFSSWKDAVWQEFSWNGRQVGAPAFIVTVFQSPNYPGPPAVREELSIWNQAWFCSLRSAMGVYRYAERTGNTGLLEKARMTKELALSFPQEDGLFDGVIATRNRTEIRDGKEVVVSGSWEDAFLGNSNRNPFTWDLGASPRHILDMSWTALHMLRWYQELEQDERLLRYAETYADRLLSLQDEKGYFPAWIDREGRLLEPLRQSPESAASALFLLELYGITQNAAYRDAALRCIDILIEEILYDGRWEDFETYWSCCRYGCDSLPGRRVERNQMYKQCNLSMYYMASALFAAWETTQDGAYLRHGRRCLDELLMTQSSFQQPWAPIPVIGGFGVMNCDGELNDSRQSLFAECILQYGRALGETEYIERGYAALRAAFTMMFCPENPQTMAMWKKRWPFLGEEDYGFMMENYGHGGKTDADGEGIGEFTIYDWGNGAAAEAYLRIRAHEGLPS